MVEYKIPLICKDVTVFIHSYKKHAEHLIRDHCTGYYPWEEKKVKKNFFPDQVRISLSYPPITVAAQGSARELRELNDHLKTFITLISQSKKFQNRNKVKTRWDRRRCSDHHTKGDEGWFFSNSIKCIFLVGLKSSHMLLNGKFGLIFWKFSHIFNRRWLKCKT